VYEWNYAGAVQFEFPGDLLGEVCLYHVENISPLLLKCAKGFFQRQSRISSQEIFWLGRSGVLSIFMLQPLKKAESNGRMEGNS
jgi:hypothetical protein